MKKETGTQREITSDWRLETQLVRGGTWRSELGETSEAMFMTSGFSYDKAEDAAARFEGTQEGYTYSRLRNPTCTMFEEKMALIEGAETARSTATGMAAVQTALMAIVKAGDHVVASRALFGSCRYILEQILPKFGVDITFVDSRENSNWDNAFRDNTTAIFIETPANPTLDVVDIAYVSKLAHAVGALVIVDNVFATPLLQKPLTFGADIVVYSATKHIDGQGRCLGGCILTSHEIMDEVIMPFYRNTGPNLSPFNAWVMQKSLETMGMRVNQMCDNAAYLADVLADSGAFTKVLYPSRTDFAQHELAMSQMAKGGSVIALHVKGGQKKAFKFLNALEIIDISNNIGDARSLITHPASTTHYSVEQKTREELGITDGMIRLSVGLEHKDDLSKDMIRAAKKAGLI
jgi:O-succinylhomoserine sulfhydrylase